MTNQMIFQKICLHNIKNAEIIIIQSDSEKETDSKDLKIHSPIKVLTYNKQIINRFTTTINNLSKRYGITSPPKRLPMYLINEKRKAHKRARNNFLNISEKTKKKPKLINAGKNNAHVEHINPEKQLILTIARSFIDDEAEESSPNNEDKSESEEAENQEDLDFIDDI